MAMVKKVTHPKSNKTAKIPATSTPKKKEPCTSPSIVAYTPKKNEKYMSPAMQAYFRDLLNQTIQELTDKLNMTVDHLRGNQEYHADENDRAAEEQSLIENLNLKRREYMLVKKMQSTLKSIDENAYGYCSECGEEIGFHRLSARPTANLCVDCKTLDEIREKQRGE
jgi:DnaK suppressor protein